MLVENPKSAPNDENKETTVITNKPTTPANQCQFCYKTFANPHNVKLHIKVDHEQSGIFKCPTCNQAFNSQNFLQMHISSAHPTHSKLKFLKEYIFLGQKNTQFLQFQKVRKHFFLD